MTIEIMNEIDEHIKNAHTNGDTKNYAKAQLEATLALVKQNKLIIDTLYYSQEELRQINMHVENVEYNTREKAPRRTYC